VLTVAIVPSNLALATLLERFLAGDRHALRALLDGLAPVIQARAARALARRKGASGRDPRQDLHDMVQEVFLALLDRDARALRAWQRDRGLSLENFVGMLAEQQVAAILRTGRRSPWTDDPTETGALETHVGVADGDLDMIVSRELLQGVLARLREELTPRMLHLFYCLWVDELDVATICEQTGMQREAVYMARSRITHRARAIAEELLGSPAPQRTSQGGT
jgi:RNA polymerase sigma-70 factor (ECF subfamily)